VAPLGDESLAPRFSMVIAAYNVGRYLSEFIESVEKQTFALDRLEVIVVDDGSTDDSLAILQDWQRRRPELVTVVSKPNAGCSSARNAGLPLASGEWITFTDPDDVLDSRYLEEVDDFLRKRPSTVMVATNRVLFSDTTREPSKHPLHRHFVPGANRLRNLDHETGHFHGGAPATFFRRDEIEAGGLRFDERLTTFEDGHFCMRYLLQAPKPLVGFVSGAVYHYRKRDDGSSQLDGSWLGPARFTDVMEHGYLALLREGAERHGRPPSWLQGMVIYELSWYLKVNERMTAPTVAYGDTVERFHGLVREVFGLLDDTGIQTYSATALKPVWREMMQHGYDDESWHTPYAVVDKLDADQNLMRVSYRYQGAAPHESFYVYGRRVTPVHHKIRDLRFFDRTLLYERVAWLPFGTVRVVLDGRDLEMRTSDPEPPQHRLTGANIKKRLELPGEAPTKHVERRLSRSETRVLRLARTRLARRYFGDAWVLMDRVFNADDSAEHLFRYLRENRPEVNAWFVIESGTPDERRLRRDGYGRRVVAHGSLRWKLLMLNCRHLISSHADEVVLRPKAITALVEPRWRTTFLQHGVIKDDLSTWLDRKEIDVFVTSTPAELESIVGDHTTYRYTTREVKLTGLPRFDRVLEEGNRFPPERRDLVVIAPTWRQWLSTADALLTGRHNVGEDFESSQYAAEWTALLNSTELRELAERNGLTLGLLLHPNLQDTARLKTLPHVVPLRFEGHNVQETFARARVLVTDYSSMFFNAAYIERPVVYFQFDRDRMHTGWHLGRKGYFDYERDGYGPVTLTVEEAIAAICKTIDSGPDPDPLYLERIRASFPERDGRCCERVADAIVESTKPVRPRPPAPMVTGLADPSIRPVADRVRRSVARVRSAGPWSRTPLA
jgi:GT2 family glycosyltransferase